MSFNKNPGLWIVISLAVIGWNLYGILGPHDEGPSQTLLILKWILVVCGVVALIAAVLQLGRQKDREKA
jgi:hypothetical protein